MHVSCLHCAHLVVWLLVVFDSDGAIVCIGCYVVVLQCSTTAARNMNLTRAAGNGSRVMCEGTGTGVVGRKAPRSGRGGAGGLPPLTLQVVQ